MTHMSDTRLLLVDGSNVVMRCALGGDVPPGQAVPTATAMIERAARQAEVTHLVIALDSPDSPCWRKDLYPAYKANRVRKTTFRRPSHQTCVCYSENAVARCDGRVPEPFHHQRTIPSTTVHGRGRLGKRSFKV